MLGNLTNQAEIPGHLAEVEVPGEGNNTLWMQQHVNDSVVPRTKDQGKKRGKVLCLVSNGYS